MKPQVTVNPMTQDDQILAELVEEITGAIEAGETVDLEAYEAKHPEYAAQLRQLVPAMQVLGDLGLSTARGSASRGPSAPASSAVRGMLGDFHILREIGRGGMGVVYEAEQTSLGRRVALKVLPFAAVLDSKQLKRFKNEARAAATLDHPGIVSIYSVGSERGVHFYAMHLIEGKTLAEVIRELRHLAGAEASPGERTAHSLSQVTSDLASGVFARSRSAGAGSAIGAEAMMAQPIGQSDQVSAPAETDKRMQARITTDPSTRTPKFFHAVADLGIQAAEALDYAHEHGILHRDIKPGNLMLDMEGTLWITDFGLARIETDAGMTMTGDVLGTFRYMSPEQVLAKRVEVDHRADVYSLGVTLYEVLTLEPAVRGDDREELLRRIAFEEPILPRRINPSIPVDLETILLKAMRKNPDERFATAGDLAADLRRFKEHRPIQAKRATVLQRVRKWSYRHRPLVWTAGIATALMLCFSILGLSISNAVISQERDEKDNALVALKAALNSTDRNLQQARQQHRRAESNLELALRAVEELCIRAIGEDRLLLRRDTEETPESVAVVALTKQERRLLEKGLGFFEQFVRHNVDQPEARFQVARAYIRVGQIRKELGESDSPREALRRAVDHLLKLTAEFPDNLDYLESLGEAYHKLGNAHWPDAPARKHYDAAVHVLSKIVDTNPNSASVYGRRGEVYRNMGFTHLSKSDFQRACELDPTNANYHFRIAMQTQHTNKLLAAQHAREAIRLDPGKPHFHFMLATILSSAGDYSRAMVHAKKCIELAPTKVDGHLALAQIYRDRGDLEDAIELLDESIQRTTGPGRTPSVHSGESSLYKVRGDYLQELGKYERALADYNKSIELDPGHSFTFKRRAKVQFQLKRFDEALVDIGRAIELTPGDLSSLSWIPPKQAATCPDERFCQGLLELADKAVSLTDGSAPAFHARGNLHAAFGRFREADIDLSRCIELDPDNAAVNNNLAWLLLTCPDRTLHNVPKALCLAEKAAELTPDAGHVWNTLGVAYYRAGKWQKAIESLNRSRRIGGNNGLSCNGFFLAMAHWQLDDKEASRRWYDKAVEWMETNSPNDEELSEFHAEAAELLNIPKTPQTEESHNSENERD